MDSEVLVIGGGPAGLATAIALRQRGLPVTVTDPCLDLSAQRPIDKCCGEGLLPAAVDALVRLGLPAARLQQHGVALQGIRFHRGKTRATANFPALEAPALGLRRTVLHGLLLGRAREAGVSFASCTARLLGDGVSGCRVLLGESARDVRWVVGADGMQSAVRSAAGLAHGSHAPQRFALRQHLRLAPGCSVAPLVEVYWARGAQAYMTPIDEQTVGVAVITRGKPRGMEEALSRFPALTARLNGAEPVSRVRGALTMHRTLRVVHGGSVALVGDASGSVDAITGDGLSLAFGQSLALAESLARGDLSFYGLAHRRLGQTPRLMSSALLTMGVLPPVTGGSMWMLARVPYLFRALLQLHTAYR